MAIEFCPLADDVGNLADWAAVGIGVIAAIATTVVAFLAYKTASRATDIADEAKKIAKRQHEDLAAVNEGNGRIVGRLLVHELSELPVKLFALNERCRRILQGEWGNLSGENVAFIEDTLQKHIRSLLPGTELSADRIHFLPEEIGNDLAVLVGYSRTLSSMSEEMLEQVVEIPLRGVVRLTKKIYVGDVRSMENYQKYVQMFSKYAMQTVNDLREFAGSDEHDFSKFDINSESSQS